MWGTSGLILSYSLCSSQAHSISSCSQSSVGSTRLLRRFSMTPPSRNICVGREECHVQGFPAKHSGLRAYGVSARPGCSHTVRSSWPSLRRRLPSATLQAFHWTIDCKHAATRLDTHSGTSSE
jgi:hypothetical protein